MLFYKKIDKEALKNAREEGFSLGAAKTKATYEKKIQKIKAVYANIIKQKINENRELDKKVKRIEDKSKYLDKHTESLYFIWHMLSSELLAEAKEISKKYGLADGVFNDIDIKKMLKEKKDKKLEKEIEEYKEKRLKLAN